MGVNKKRKNRAWEGKTWNERRNGKDHEWNDWGGKNRIRKV